jgi:multiple antibiotic resistance protein
VSESINFFVSVWIKFFFLLTPFFVLSLFLAMTRGLQERQRRKLAARVTVAIVLACFALYFFGNTMFRLFGITLDSFRIGAGALLFLSAVVMVRESDTAPAAHGDDDIAVVPLAIPITVGPATTGALLVMGAEMHDALPRIIGCAALLGAVLCVGVLLYLAASVERVIGKKGIVILSKLTGLVLAALAAQIVFTGIRNLLRAG